MEENLSAEQLGARLHELRRQRQLTLQELAERSGVSRAMLSKIERGEKMPTVVLALRIAQALGLTMSQLLGVVEQRAVVLLPKRQQLVYRDPESGIERHLLSPPFEGPHLEFLRYVLPEGATTGEVPAHPRGVEKYVLVEQGRLCVSIAGQEYLLEAGDTLYFEADTVHRYENRGSGSCSYYLVATSGKGSFDKESLI
jgi:transcriptional regulator with XRE-family HTH domain